MKSLAEVALRKKIKLDWRLEYIEKNTDQGKESFDIWKRLHLSKEKLTVYTNNQIEIHDNSFYEGKSYDITEVCVITVIQLLILKWVLVSPNRSLYIVLELFCIQTGLPALHRDY